MNTNTLQHNTLSLTSLPWFKGTERIAYCTIGKTILKSNGKFGGYGKGKNRI